MTTINIEEVVARAGNREERRRSLADFSRRARLLEGKKVELTEQYPRKWVALTVGDDWYFADTVQGLVKELKEAGKRLTGNVVKYLDPEPKVWIL